MIYREIPSDFNYRSISLDAFSTYVRDILSLPVEAWVRFLYRIHDADSSAVLFSKKGISPEVQQTFLEIGMLHKAILIAFGNAKQRLITLQQQASANRFLAVQASLESYMHMGTALDHLSRITFMITQPDAATKRTLQGKILRHHINFSVFRKEYNVSGYRKLFGQKPLKELETICHNCIQTQPFPSFFAEKGNKLVFPTALRSSNKPWIVELYKPRFRKYIALPTMVQNDFEVLMNFQDALYHKLTEAVISFEKRHGMVIR